MAPMALTGRVAITEIIRKAATFHAGGSGRAVSTQLYPV
jgi:hypothetical protein